MAELQLSAGHSIFLVRLRMSSSDTPATVEERVVEWLGDALGADESRRSREGEYVIGPANPVTVVPLLGLTDREFADREAALCQGDAVAFLGALPPGATGGAMVHLDWRGVETALPTRWSELLSWSPSTDQNPDLAVTAACFRADIARPPIEPPSALDDLRENLPRPEIPQFLRSPTTWIGVGLVAVVGLALWSQRKR